MLLTAIYLTFVEENSSLEVEDLFCLLQFREIFFWMISTLSRLGLLDLQSATYCLHLAKDSRFLWQPCCYLWFIHNTTHESYRHNLFFP